MQENQNKKKRSIQSEIDLIMNPVRMRIMQYLLIHRSATTQEIGKQLPDVSSATLYRHIKKLLDGGVLTIEKEIKVRGALERTYMLSKRVTQNRKAEGIEPTGENILTLIYSLMMRIYGNFHNYLQQEDADMARDGYLAQTSSWYLTQEEYMEFLQKLSGLIQELLKSSDNTRSEGKRMIQLSIFTNPVVDDNK